MANLLFIESSPRATSVSSAVAREYVAEWQRKHPEGTVTRRNVATHPVPHITEAWIAATFTPAENRTPEQKQLLALSDALIGELEAADTIVIAVPMHNFGISSHLKTWIDQIVRAGRTFTISAEGYKGLLGENKKVIIVTARGGSYASGSPLGTFDHQEPYLRAVLGSLGLKDLHFVHAENQNRGAEAAQQGFKSGVETVLALA